MSPDRTGSGDADYRKPAGGRLTSSIVGNVIRRSRFSTGALPEGSIAPRVTDRCREVRLRGIVRLGH